MGDIFLSDFKYGMDRRRTRVAGTPGTLWNAQNVVITRGGDIERAKRFVPTYTLPAGRRLGSQKLGGSCGPLARYPPQPCPWASTIRRWPPQAARL